MSRGSPNPNFGLVSPSFGPSSTSSSPYSSAFGPSHLAADVHSDASNSPGFRPTRQRTSLSLSLSLLLSLPPSSTYLPIYPSFYLSFSFVPSHLGEKNIFPHTLPSPSPSLSLSLTHTHLPQPTTASPLVPRSSVRSDPLPATSLP